MTRHPYCDVCEHTDVEGTRKVCVTEGEVEVCYECLTENASVKEIRQAAIDAGDMAHKMGKARLDAITNDND